MTDIKKDVNLYQDDENTGCAIIRPYMVYDRGAERDYSVSSC